jgi:hypothetical protein
MALFYFDDTQYIMWIGKNSAPAVQTKKRTVVDPTEVLDVKPLKELHVPHHVEDEIAAFLIQKGRLEMRIGKQLMHFVGIVKNGDGSVTYTVKTRMHTHTGLERNFTSEVRIFPGSRRPQLIA